MALPPPEQLWLCIHAVQLSLQQLLAVFLPPSPRYSLNDTPSFARCCICVIQNQHPVQVIDLVLDHPSIKPR